MEKIMSPTACKSIEEIMAIPFYSQFTREQIKTQLLGNLSGLRKMLAISESKGKKVGGYTAEQLKEMIAHFEMLTK